MKIQATDTVNKSVRLSGYKFKKGGKKLILPPELNIV